MADEGFKLDEPAETERGPFQASKEDYEATRRRKALCLKNFMMIVERFAQNPVTKEMVAIALPWLEREQFDDIPVERFAYKNCGYVLCPKPLPETQLKQKYRICSAKGRVYEVRDRKYFCHDWCYSASRYLRRQIPRDPVWCRALPTGPMLNLKFYPAHAPGRPGKTILDALANIQLNADIENTGVNKKSIYSSSSSSSEHEDGDCNLKLMSSYTEDGDSEISDCDDTALTSDSKSVPWNEVILQPKTSKIIEKKSKNREQLKRADATVNKKNKTSPKREVKAEKVVESVPKGVVLNRLQEWVTKEAVEMLYSDESTTLTIQAKPLFPEYEAKVNAFLSEDTKAENEPIVLPLVDSISQGSLRLQILLQSLLPCLKSILLRMEVPLNPTLDKLRNFITHFHLTSKNLHVQPKELNITCCSLLHLLTAKVDKLIPHDKLVQMLSASFDGDKAQAEAHLASVMEIADRLHEESLDMPS